jgi:hypothetical protein
MILGNWVLFYLLPTIISVLLKSTQTVLLRRALIMHTGIIVSIVLVTTFSEASLNWQFQNIYLAVMALTSLLIAMWLIGFTGLLYAISSSIQEWCILLAGTYLSMDYGIMPSAIATSLVFATAHGARSSERSWKWPLLFAWSIISLLLYAWLKEPLLNISLHIVLGAILINRKFLYKEI